MRQEATLAAALIAGGKSTRMGRDKACLMNRDGRELWRGRLELLREMAAGEVLLSCRGDQDYLAGSGARLVLDQWENAGPLGGIVSCLEAMASDRLLVLAVDLPAMTREGLEALLEAAGGWSPATGTVSQASLPPEDGTLSGAVFRCGGYSEPLVAVYPKSMAVSGRRRLEAGEYALRGWIDEAGDTMRELEVPPDWAGLFVNVNDPSAWEQWLRERR